MSDLMGILTNNDGIVKFQFTSEIGSLMKQLLSIPAQLGPLLKAARKATGLSQSKLAERLGISQSRMSHMELNPGSVSLAQLLAIFAVLDLEIVVGDRSSAANVPAMQTAEPTRRYATARLVDEPKPEW